MKRVTWSLRWAVALAVVVAVAQAGLSAQTIPILKSVNFIADTMMSIVRPLAVVALIASGLMWMFGEGSVRYIGQILFGGCIAIFAASIVNALF